MDQENISKLRVDRRLTSRRGWISEEDLEAALEQLPDVSHKIAEIDGKTPEAPGESAPPSQT